MPHLQRLRVNGTACHRVPAAATATAALNKRRAGQRAVPHTHGSAQGRQRAATTRLWQPHPQPRHTVTTVCPQVHCRWSCRCRCCRSVRCHERGPRAASVTRPQRGCVAPPVACLIACVTSVPTTTPTPTAAANIVRRGCRPQRDYSRSVRPPASHLAPAARLPHRHAPARVACCQPRASDVTRRRHVRQRRHLGGRRR